MSNKDIKTTRDRMHKSICCILNICAIGLAISPSVGTPALAQATLQQQRVVQKDICDDLPNPDATHCAQDAMWSENWPAFLKWSQKAAANGNYIAANWLADEYEYGVIDGYKDYVRVYMWYDIAAQLHARQIQKMPPSSGGLGPPESNQREINLRDDAAAKLSTDQIAEALKLEKEWLSEKR